MKSFHAFSITLVTLLMTVGTSCGNAAEAAGVVPGPTRIQSTSLQGAQCFEGFTWDGIACVGP